MLRILISAGMLSAVSCSKINLPQTTQEPATPASSETVQTAFSAAPSNDPHPSVTQAAPSVAPSATSTASPGAAQAPLATAMKVHPAMGAKEAAMKMYPALAVKDSTFNKIFRDLYVEKTRQEPEFLTKADWPLTLAHRTAELLAAQTAASATPSPTSTSQQIAMAPTPAPSPRVFKPSLDPNPLDRGAYNQVRSPNYYYWNGYYYTYPYAQPTTRVTTSPAAAAAAPTTTAQTTPAPTTNPLDRGAYNQTRSPYWWPWTYYYP